MEFLLKQLKSINSQIKYFSFFALLIFIIPFSAFAALSCTVAATCPSGYITILKMSATSNGHAELPSQSNYANRVCCGGVEGISNSCSNTQNATFIRLSGDTNAHIEEHTERTATYDGHNACISLPVIGNITVDYRENACDSSETVAFSMSSSTTNAHIGDGDAYTHKVCLSASREPCSGSNIACTSGNAPDSPPLPPGTPGSPALRTGDFNGDGHVNILDLSILLYYIDQGDYAYSVYDLNQDGKLDFLDISVLFYYWDLEE